MGGGGGGGGKQGRGERKHEALTCLKKILGVQLTKGVEVGMTQI